MNWIMAILFMIGLYRWTLKLVPEAAPLLTGLTMVNATLWIYYRRTLSELAFVTVMIWTVNALDRTLDASSVHEHVLVTLVGCALAVYLSMIREVGALFVVGFAIAICASAYEGDQKLRSALANGALVAIPALLAVIGFVAYDQFTFEGQRNHFGTHLNGFLHPRLPLQQGISEGLRLQISAIGRLIVPGMFNAYGHSWLNINTFIYICIAAGIAVGWSRLVRQRIELLTYTLPLYVTLYAVWGFDAGTRYMLPMLPILMVSVWKLIEPYRSCRLSVLTALLVLHVSVAFGYWRIVEIPWGRQCNQLWPEVTAITSFTKHEPGPVAIAGKSPVCMRWMLSFALDQQVFDINADETALESSEWIVVPIEDPKPWSFQMVAKIGTYKLLRRLQSGSSNGQ
jgi:hypothetical protein